MHPLSREVLNAGETLPSYYGEDTLVLLARDPHWLFAYWELTPGKVKEYLDKRGRNALVGAKKSLRVKKYDHQGKEMTSFDIPLNENAEDWYINVGEPDRSYQAQLGFILSNGIFVNMITSNKCHTPRDSISSVIDPRWGYLNFWQHQLFYRSLKFNLNSAELIRREKKMAKNGGKKN